MPIRKAALEGGGDQPPEQPKGTPSKPGIDDAFFLDNISQQLRQRNEPNEHLLVNIPIWGWTGDGKTCALLTAVHFCDPAQHPLSFAFISNTDELVSLESADEDYKGLNLVSTAIANTERLRGLAEGFIDGNDWPPGTDEPSSYILAVRNATATLGYVLFPDLKGGSYRELDEAARNVLERAHAAILLVNPETYQKKTTEGKRYRDEILARLQDFGKAKVPVCVMITKADLYLGQDRAADETHAQLTILVDQQKSLESLVCRVSVIGSARSPDDDQFRGAADGKQIPSVADRHPESMVKAWIWIVAQALCRPVEDIRRRLPAVNIGRTGNRSVDLGFQTIPELRQIGDFSGSPGRVLCATSDSPHAKAFTFLSGEGELLETVFEIGSQPQFKVVGSIPGWDQSGVRCDYIGGEFLIGRPSSCNFIWLGARGGELVKAPFPYEMTSWVSMTPRRILSIDKAGRLHSLGLVGGKWTQTDYIDEFILPTPYLTCAFAERSSYVLVFNGETAQSAAVGADGKLGAQAVPGYANKFDTGRTVTNRLGLCLALSASGAGRLSGPGKAVEIGPVKADVEEPIALAPNASVIATVTPDLRVIATSMVAAQVTQTAAAHSPQIDANPQSMAWTPDGGLLAVSFEDKTWRVYRPFGLSM